MLNTRELALIRQWWYLYAQVLRPGAPERIRAEWLAQDRKLADAGIPPPGHSMPRAGAEELAEECDRLRRTHW